MESDLAQLYTTLEEHLVGLRKDSSRLREHLGALDQVLREHRALLPAKLTHYLERRSYDKALAFVQGEE